MALKDTWMCHATTDSEQVEPNGCAVVKMSMWFVDKAEANQYDKGWFALEVSYGVFKGSNKVER